MKRNRRLAFLLAAQLSLASCTVGPDFRRPDAPTAKTYTSEIQNNLLAGDQQVISGQNPDADWWHLFGSAELDATVAQALAGNRGLAAAHATLAQARESLNATSGAQYPQFNLFAGAGRQKYGAQFGGPEIFPPFTYFSIGPNVSYLLDYTGGERRAVEQQRALAEYQAYELRAATLSLAANVVQQVLALASARAQIDEMEALLAEDRKNINLVQSSFDAGSATRVDILSAQSQLATDETLLPALRQQLSVASHALSILVGHAPADWTPPEFSLQALRLPQSLSLSLPSELAHRRPDILAAESQLHAATAAIGVAQAQLYPQIVLTASAGQQALTFASLFDKSGAVFGLAAGITAPIFDGGTRRAQRRGAQDAMQAALANYEQTVLESFGQVADALTALNHDADQIIAQQHSLDSATAGLALTRESYSVGNVGVLQVLDAQRLYQQARFGYVRVQAQRYQDTVQLFLALGGCVPGDSCLQ